MTSAKSVCLIIVISLRFGLPPFSPLPRDDDSKTHSSHNQKFKTLGRIYSTQRIVNVIMVARRLCAKAPQISQGAAGPPSPVFLGTELFLPVAEAWSPLSSLPV